MGLQEKLRDLADVMRMPAVTVNLMARAAQANEPFYQRMVSEFYALTQTRHRKLPLVRHWQYGVALCALPATFASYQQSLAAPGPTLNRDEDNTNVSVSATPAPSKS